MSTSVYLLIQLTLIKLYLEYIMTLFGVIEL